MLPDDPIGWNTGHFLQITENHMFDGAFFSHVLLWVIGAMTVCAAGATFAALFSMGRSGYRKD